MTITDEQAGRILDDLREESPINGAVQDLATFIIHTEDNEGKITSQNALYLAEAAKQAVTLLLAELHRLQRENAVLSVQAHPQTSERQFGERKAVILPFRPRD